MLRFGPQHRIVLLGAEVARSELARHPEGWAAILHLILLGRGQIACSEDDSWILARNPLCGWVNLAE
jgi:hypothetical protein